jgi:predicted phosphate transport protein (TIGR00153 family)
MPSAAAVSQQPPWRVLFRPVIRDIQHCIRKADRSRIFQERGQPMLGWFKAIMPREERFFTLFAQHAAIVVAGAEALVGVLKGGDQVGHFCKIISDRETEADAVTRDVLTAVRRSFITPFDRTDIQDLVSSMDDAIDQMNKTAKAIMLFEVRSFEPQMQAMGEIVLQASKLVQEAMPLLGAMGKNAARLQAIVEEIIRIEDKSDHLYDQGRKALFLANRGGNTMDYIVGNEVYDHLESVVDKLEDVSNEINALLVDQL